MLFLLNNAFGGRGQEQSCRLLQMFLRTIGVIDNDEFCARSNAWLKRVEAVYNIAPAKKQIE